MPWTLPLGGLRLATKGAIVMRVIIGAAALSLLVACTQEREAQAPAAAPPAPASGIDVEYLDAGIRPGRH